MAIAEAWASGDRAAVEHAVSDALIDATSIAGTRIGDTGRHWNLLILSPCPRGPVTRARFEAVIGARASTATAR